MSSAKSSPSPPSDNPNELQDARVSQVGKDAVSSLKRVREGSLEPNASPTSATPKKNRLATTPSDRRQASNESTAEVEGDQITEVDTPDELGEQSSEAKDDAKTGPEGRTVGEVRRKVEKMTYEEGQQPDKGNPANSGLVEADEPADDDEDKSWEKVELEGDAAAAAAGEGLKRKALDRSESSFAQEEEDATVKRQKDTPPPDVQDAKLDTAPAKKPQTTFSSFASSSSPFAAMKSPSPASSATPAPSIEPAAPIPVKKPQATFGSFARTSSPFVPASSASPAVPSPEPSKTVEEPVPTKKPQATFGAFSSSSSPFGGSKATSAFGSTPNKGSAFGNYSATASAFGTKKSTPGEGDTEAGPSAFGDILKEHKDDETEAETKVRMQEQDVLTGEEDEETVYQTRAKLYFSDKASGAWKERGVGLLKLNVRRADALGARLVMRSDGVYSLLLNAKLYKGLNPHVDGKIVRMSIMQAGNEFTLITLRFSNPKVAAELADHIHEHVPLDNAKTPQPESV